MACSTLRRFALASLAAVATVTCACAQTVEEFYKKTPLSVYVGSGAGGGFDEIARVFSVHFARHLGEVQVTTRSMSYRRTAPALRHGLVFTPSR